MDESWRKKVLVAGIDFGTTFSGFAVSILDYYNQDSTKVLTKHWTPEEGKATDKTPTCLLLEPGGNFHSFGYEAEEQYMRLSEEGSHKQWRYFRRFKMKLFSEDNKAITDVSTVEDSEGRPLKALHVFSFSIRYLKNQVEQLIIKRLAGNTDLIHYVITTPAIWNEASKQFMRRAAVDAGIPEHRLRIALEPECAALYVKAKWFPRLERVAGDNSKVFKKGSRHMIVDMGGGTIDIAVHLVNDEGKLEEIVPPNGGPWGGDEVNKKFESFLLSLVGAETFLRFRDKHCDDFLELSRQFEVKKKRFRPESTSCNFRLSKSFRDLHKKTNEEKLAETIKKVPNSALLGMTADKLRIDEKLFNTFFQEPADKVVNLMREIIDKIPARIDTILCVGGFSECAILQHRIQTEFSTYDVIFPPEPAAAIMNGAVIYGREIREIVSRVCRYTYGLDWNEDFKPGVHPESKREETHDDCVCRDIFLTLAKKGDVFPVEGKTAKVEAYVKYKEQTRIDFPFYRSEVSECPKYVDDVGCVHVGTLVVDLPEQHGPNDCVTLEVIFGATELRAEATIGNGKKIQVTFNILGSVDTVVRANINI